MQICRVLHKTHFLDEIFLLSGFPEIIKYPGINFWAIADRVVVLKRNVLERTVIV